MRYSVVIPEKLDQQLFRHLVREDEQEDLCFAFYNPSTGAERFTAVIKEIILPENGDRNVHRNVSFNSQYWDKVTAYALEHGLGICFMHSHPASGWQGMSSDDIKAETMLSPLAKAVTTLPLVGLTLGNDGTWSARFWMKTKPKKYERFFCESVRIVGNGFKAFHFDELFPKREHGPEFARTVSAWGMSKQDDISKLRVGIVGLGSVGSIIAEALMRTGIRNLTFIDFDKIETKNLDRLLGVNRSGIGQRKVRNISRRLKRTKLLKDLNILCIPESLATEKGIRAALDCDVLFSCVDRPLPRYLLDKLSYANGIPVIDGGIDASINVKHTNLDQARWKAHTVGPGRICMKCIGQYTENDVSLELSGLLDDVTYIKGLPADHFINRGENVFGFSLGVAGMEFQQFLSLVLQPRKQYYGCKEYDFNSGNIDFDFDFNCKSGCAVTMVTGAGDKVNNHLASPAPAKTQKSVRLQFAAVFSNLISSFFHPQHPKKRIL